MNNLISPLPDQLVGLFFWLHLYLFILGYLPLEKVPEFSVPQGIRVLLGGIALTQCNVSVEESQGTHH